MKFKLVTAWSSVVPEKKQRGLGIDYIIDKNHGLITLP